MKKARLRNIHMIITIILMALQGVEGGLKMIIERDGDIIHYRYGQNESNNLISGTIAPLIAVRVVDDEQLKRYWDYCAGIIKPSGHSVQEALNWIEENWDLQPLPSDHIHMNIKRGTIAMNRFPEQYKAPEISSEMTDEEIEERIKKGNSRLKAAQETTDDQLGIRLHGYSIPYTPRNQLLYDEGFEAYVKRMAEYRRFAPDSYPDQIPPIMMEQEKHRADAYLFIEETEAQIISNGIGAGPLCSKLAVYIGISKEDIETRSHRFISYVNHMSENGEILTLQEFCGEK